MPDQLLGGADTGIAAQQKPDLNNSSQFAQLIDVITALSSERNINKLYEKIVETAQALTRADGATLYIVDKNQQPPVLQFAIVRNNSLDLKLGGDAAAPINFAPIPLIQANGQKNLSNISAWVYHKQTPFNIKDAYTVADFDFSGTKKFDQKTGYRSESMLTLPLINHADDVVGVLQLLNAKDADNQTIIFDESAQRLALALASSAAITLDTQGLIQSHKDLLDAFVQVIAKAIDAKSSHTSAHCQRVPALTELLAQAACQTNEGPLKDFTLNDDEWYELHVAAWLHDCGKLATPDHILDKATKLHLLTDRIEIIQARFAAHIAQLENQLLGTTDKDEQKALKEQIKQRRDDCAFLVTANQGGEFMQTSDQERVRAIGQLRWVDIQGQEQPLLTAEEIDLLCIERGTLSADERQIINDHIVVTIDMLEELPFPKHLARVPEYAGGHHERVDGKGYPKGLRGDQMSWPARMMAIADVFEALTARDRPYKEPMRLSQALGILKNMAETGHIDPDLYQIFISKKVWHRYGQQYLLAEQLDVTTKEAQNYLLSP